jgi:hypothetical protein
MSGVLPFTICSTLSDANMRPSFEQELDIAQKFTDFINRQVGVYCDSLTAFTGNKARIERHLAHVMRPSRRYVEDGVPHVMWASFEEPNRPEPLLHRIIPTKQFADDNSERGYNHQQTCWSAIVFLFSYWDEDIRPALARARGVEPNMITVDAFGDLRVLRKAIIHNGGFITATEHGKLKLFGEMFSPGTPITPSHDEMHRIFLVAKKALAQLILADAMDLPGAPKLDEIAELTVQRGPRIRNV